jgi:hypothetical protein
MLYWGRSKEFEYHDIASELSGDPEIDGYLLTPRELARRLNIAEKFEFVSLPFEQSPVGYDLPAMTEVEFEAWWQRLIPLPSPVCWYECRLPDGLINGFLIEADEAGWLVRNVVLTHQ